MSLNDLALDKREALVNHLHSTYSLSGGGGPHLHLISIFKRPQSWFPFLATPDSTFVKVITLRTPWRSEREQADRVVRWLNFAEKSDQSASTM